MGCTVYRVRRETRYLEDITDAVAVVGGGSSCDCVRRTAGEMAFLAPINCIYRVYIAEERRRFRMCFFTFSRLGRVINDRTYPRFMVVVLRHSFHYCCRMSAIVNAKIRHCFIRACYLSGTQKKQEAAVMKITNVYFSKQ